MLMSISRLARVSSQLEALNKRPSCIKKNINKCHPSVYANLTCSFYSPKSEGEMERLLRALCNTNSITNSITNRITNCASVPDRPLESSEFGWFEGLSWLIVSVKIVRISAVAANELFSALQQRRPVRRWRASELSPNESASIETLY